MSKSRRRHSWALAFKRSDPEVRALTRQARDGLEYAASLARNARERSEAALAGEELPAPLTADDLADGWTSPVEVHAAIKQARIELFGKDLSNSAIAYRVCKRREREPRLCAEPGCDRQLSRLAHASKRYCSDHDSGRARIARHRRRRAAG